MNARSLPRRFLWLFFCLFCAALPRGVQAQSNPQPNDPKTSDQKPNDQKPSEPKPGDQKTCVPPKFAIQGWLDPGILVISATSTPARKFEVQIALGGSSGLKTDRCVDAAALAARYPEKRFDYLFCAKDFEILEPGTADDKSVPQTTIFVQFSRGAFQRLLDEDGKLHVHALNPSPDCKVDTWQDLTGFNRSLFRIEAGAVYGLNGDGNWDSRGEAAVRFSTRWLTDWSGAAEFRYTGISKTSEQPPQQSTGSPARKTTDTGNSGQNFDPFKASDGVLRADFYLGYHLPDVRPWKWHHPDEIPTLNSSLVLGFGLSSLKGETAGREDLTKVKRRLFAGYRLTVPRFKIDSGTDEVPKSLKEITAPRGYIQFSYARDEIWKFTAPGTVTGTTIPVDKRDRLVVDGIFEFFEVPTSGDSIPITARLRWDAPITLNGASDLRISILGAFNFFKL